MTVEKVEFFTCSGMTKAGNPCKSRIKKEDTHCWRHKSKDKTNKNKKQEITWVSNDKNFDDRMIFFLDKRLENIPEAKCFEPLTDLIKSFLLELKDCSLTRFNETEEINLIKDLKRITNYYVKKFKNDDYSQEEFEELLLLDKVNKEQSTKRRTYKHLETNISKLVKNFKTFFESCQVEDSTSDEDSDA